MLKLRYFLHIKGYLFLFNVTFLPYFFVLIFPPSLVSFLFFLLLLFIVFSVSLYLIIVPFFSAFLSLVSLSLYLLLHFSYLVLLLSFRGHKKENRDISPSLTVCVENHHIQNQPHQNTFVEFTCVLIWPA